MKKIILGALLLLSTLGFGQIFNENFGTGANLSSVTDYYNNSGVNTFHELYPTIYSGEARIGGPQSPTTTVSYAALTFGIDYDLPVSNYTNNTNASGGGYVLLHQTYNSLLIENVNTLNTNSSLSFGLRVGKNANYYTNHLLLEQSIDGNNWTPIDFLAPPQNQWVYINCDTPLISTHYLKIRFTFTATVNGSNFYPGTLLIDDIKINDLNLSTNQNTLTELNLYPNPTTGNLYLSTNTDKNIKVYDMIGNKIIDKDITNFLDTSNLSSGIYLCEITEGENKLTKKIIKN